MPPPQAGVASRECVFGKNVSDMVLQGDTCKGFKCSSVPKCCDEDAKGQVSENCLFPDAASFLAAQSAFADPQGQILVGNMLSEGNSSLVIQSVGAFVLIFVIAAVSLFLIVEMNVFAAVTIGLLFGQVAMNMVVFPSSISFWVEFNSFLAIYWFLQLFPFVVVLSYTVWTAFKKDHRRGKNTLPKQ